MEVLKADDNEFIEKFKDALPRKQRRNIDDELISKIRAMACDRDMADEYKAKMLSYTRVLADGRYKIDSYIDAIKFVSYKVSGLGIKESYELTFPDKVALWRSEGRDDKRMSANISMYNKNELVNLIFEQTMIPTHILNAGLFQEALNEAADIMRNSNSDIARVQAINAILANTKAPVSTKVEIDVGISGANVIDDYEKVIGSMVKAQKELIAAGGNIYSIANASIIPAIDVEVE